MHFYTTLFKKWIAPSEKNFVIKTVNSLPIIGKNRLVEKTIDFFLMVVGIDWSNRAVMEKKSLARYSIVPAALMGTVIFSTSLPIIVFASICLLGYTAQAALNCAYDYFTCRNDFKAFDKWLKDDKATGDKQEALKRIIKNFIAKDYSCNFMKLGLNSLPKEVFKYLPHLQSLNLSYNEIKELPDEFFELKNLEHLHLNNNHFNTIPENISKLENLNFLGLGSNQIEVVSDGVCKLKKLYQLCLQNNKIKEIPREIANLKNLINLNLSDNSIKKLPPLWGLNKLEYLNLGYNNLTDLEIDPSLFYLTAIKWLYLNNNYLEEIPTALGNLSNLQSLKIYSPLIESYPPSIERLKRLERREQGEYSL